MTSEKLQSTKVDEKESKFNLIVIDEFKSSRKSYSNITTETERINNQEANN
jgi:hypothetical protein